MDGKPLTMESAVEILRKDGSALASLEEETILNLKETYVNSVGLLGKYVPKVYNGDILFFRSTVIPDWFDPISPNTWLNYLDGQICSTILIVDIKIYVSQVRLRKLDKY